MPDFSKPGLVIFDMDSTLITIECIDEIAALAGCKDKVSAITERAMRGELDFAESLRARVAALAGVTAQQMNAIFEPIPLTPGAERLITWLQQHQWYVGLVSGGFTWFTEKVQQRLGLNFCHANTLIWNAEKLTGTVAEPIVDAQTKADCLVRWAAELGIESGQTIAIGDGANDIPMLEAASFGIAFCAKPALRNVATLCVDVPDLSAVIDYFEKQEPV
ncbi:phosphoserine phosphatase SerB [Pseudidiomarina tainanensis]|jgi:phosphoserine phosphatase|uniref:Phosphoserine phosphatase n=2 Tax=Pseudidiomarina TaxID=2800384 RepID=A0A1I6I299_9GAMM|nr:MULTISPECIES: phosphoserine phosphatase SerB [Pseudidiomarina]RZQ55200.1 phosphoserine phosphatase SerB [Pseudidiomarina tainanensis]SFR60852.1 phosphoserine phosphatase [Pseudidiomarina maritima]